jgi:hypothetical protein
MERNGSLARPCLQFERELNREKIRVVKYDLVEVDTLLPTFEETEMKRPPYMAPMVGSSSGRGLDATLLDAKFL